MDSVKMVKSLRISSSMCMLMAVKDKVRFSAPESRFHFVVVAPPVLVTLPCDQCDHTCVTSVARSRERKY
jgi:hypothetical protein